MKFAATMRAVAFAVLLVTLGACSSFAPKLETPRLTIINVAMTSGDMFSQNFLVHLNVQNPNDRELPIKGIDYKLFLQGDSFAEGVTPTPFVLQRLNGKRTVEYVIEGQVMLQSGMIRKIPFRESGSVDLAMKM